MNPSVVVASYLRWFHALPSLSLIYGLRVAVGDRPGGPDLVGDWPADVGDVMSPSFARGSIRVTEDATETIANMGDLGGGRMVVLLAMEAGEMTHEVTLSTNAVIALVQNEWGWTALRAFSADTWELAFLGAQDEERGAVANHDTQRRSMRQRSREVTRAHDEGLKLWAAEVTANWTSTDLLFSPESQHGFGVDRTFFCQDGVFPPAEEGYQAGGAGAASVAELEAAVAEADEQTAIRLADVAEGYGVSQIQLADN